MAPSGIPKVAIPQEKWPSTVYSTPSCSLAQAEVAALGAVRFDGPFWSKAYTQCIGRGLTPKECAAALPDDTKITPPGPLSGASAAADMAAAIDCMGQNGDLDKCTSHFDALAKAAGYEEEVKKGSIEKGKEFCGKAGYKLLGLPVLFYAMKFIKIK